MRSAACIVFGALGLCAGGCGAERGRGWVSPLPAGADAVAPATVTLGLNAASRGVPIATLEPLPHASSEALEVATVQTLEAAWRDHDVSKLCSRYTANARVAFSGFPDANGKGAIEEAARSFWAAFPDAKYARGRVWRAAAVAIVEGAWTGTNDGAFLGSKPTHRTAGGVTLSLIWFQPDGLVREQHVYSDVSSVAMQLGLAQTKGRPFDGLPTSREEHSANGTVVEQANVESVRARFSRLRRTNWKEFLSWIADDAEYVDFTQPGWLTGKAGAERWFRAWTNAASDSTEVEANLWGMEDYVIREHVSPRAGAEQGARDAKGSLRDSAVEVLEIRDGRWVRVWRYANALDREPHAR